MLEDNLFKCAWYPNQKDCTNDSTCEWKDSRCQVKEEDLTESRKCCYPSEQNYRQYLFNRGSGAENYIYLELDKDCHNCDEQIVPCHKLVGQTCSRLDTDTKCLSNAGCKWVDDESACIKKCTHLDTADKCAADIECKWQDASGCESVIEYDFSDSLIEKKISDSQKELCEAVPNNYCVWEDKKCMYNVNSKGKPYMDDIQCRDVGLGDVDSIQYGHHSPVCDEDEKIGASFLYQGYSDDINEDENENTESSLLYQNEESEETIFYRIYAKIRDTISHWYNAIIEFIKSIGNPFENIIEDSILTSLIRFAFTAALFLLILKIFVSGIEKTYYAIFPDTL